MNEARRTNRPKAASLKPLAMLRPFIARYKGTLLAALFALLVASAASLALPIAARFVVDNGFVTRNLDAVDRYFGWFFAVCIAYSLFSALRYYLVVSLGERVVADIRNAVYEKVIRMDPSFFEVTRTGEVLSRLTTDTTLVQSISGSGLSIALRSTLSLVGGLVMLVLTSPRMAGYTLLGIFIVVVPVLIVGRFIRKLSRQSQDRVADTSGLAGETLGAMQTVQSFTLEKLQSKRYAEAVRASFLVALKRVRMVSILVALAFALVFSMLTVFLWVGSRAVMDGSMTLGQLSQFLMYAFLVGSSVMALSNIWGDVQRAAGAMERLAELLQSKPMIRIPDNPLPLPGPLQGRIRFEHVGFSYPSRPQERALDDFSLQIERGDTLAIV
ncbi:MAG: ABC transporter transmembrane domain-containing protein, partial [Xanthomonadales bacterium]|nr:ABC transporter transmembrane domain-containing protein [Xanthomonadales bacterium]